MTPTPLEKLAIEAVALAGGPHPCHVLGHKWRHIGGANAGCDEDTACACSVPVYKCVVCDDSDYGDNQEADDIMKDCRERRQCE